MRPHWAVAHYHPTCSRKGLYYLWKSGDYHIVQGLSIDAFSRTRMDASHAELIEERDGVRDLLP